LWQKTNHRSIDRGRNQLLGGGRVDQSQARSLGIISHVNDLADGVVRLAET